MRDRLDEFGNAHIAAITFADASQLPAHRAHLDLPFPLLADPDRVAYGQFGLGRGSLRQIWSPGTLKMYAGLVRRGPALRRPQDTRQLGGDFIVDRHGLLATGFWPTSPDDRPSIDALITAVHNAD